MERSQKIFQTIKENYQPLKLEIVNDSAKHRHSADGQSHFTVLVVSTVFENQNLVERQQKIMELLKDEFQNGLHALSLKTYTPKEWQKTQNVELTSPPCLKTVS